MKEKKWSPTGDNIQIRYEKYLKGGYVLNQTLTLNVVSLGFMSKNDDEWTGYWEGQPIWVKFTRPGWEVKFSDNFPSEHRGAAQEEVKRIQRQFN